MEKLTGQEFHLYKDMKERTKGELYMGVVGPVRTGKSTFIRRFMELCVLPYMEDDGAMMRATDELPQAAQGKTVMTTEPKFIPAKAAEIALEDNVSVNVRLIDCVGFMVEGAQGHMENGEERMVMTPWFDMEIPFTKAAHIGTQKVIREHATLGIVVTTDGSITDLPREAYRNGEKETIEELKNIGKPFTIVLNTKRPFSEETKVLAREMEKAYGVSVFPMNVEQMRREDMITLLETLLYEFPVTKISFFTPKWTYALETEHKVKACLLRHAKEIMEQVSNMKSVMAPGWERELQEAEELPSGEYVGRIQRTNINYANGEVEIEMEVPEKYYYENISELTGEDIRGEYELIALIRNLAAQKQTYLRVEDAIQQVEQKGYGVIIPGLTEVEMAEPEVVKQGNKYGIRLRALAPSVHLIRANIETEIAPIIGSKEQAEDLMEYIRLGQKTEDGIWQTNIFGKSIGDLVQDGIRDKMKLMDEESQTKLQETMQKIVNDNNGGMVCIII